MSELVVRPAIERHPVHDSISEEQIGRLVDSFYADVWADPVLGPIFSSRIKERDAHLVKMKNFWSSVLLHTGRYKGRPMPAHVKLSEVQEEDFGRWLRLFEKSVREVFSPDAVPLVMEKAQRIAQSFWLAMFGGLSGAPPNWAQNQT